MTSESMTKWLDGHVEPLAGIKHHPVSKNAAKEVLEQWKIAFQKAANKTADLKQKVGMLENPSHETVVTLQQTGIQIITAELNADLRKIETLKLRKGTDNV